MTFYQNEEQLYTAFREMFSRLEQDPEAVAAVENANMIFRFKCSNPNALVTFDSKKKPYQIWYGSTKIKPTLDIILAADTLHLILLGELPLKKALADKRLKVEGPIFKIFSLAPIFDRSKKLYPQTLKDLRFTNEN